MDEVEVEVGFMGRGGTILIYLEARGGNCIQLKRGGKMMSIS